MIEVKIDDKGLKRIIGNLRKTITAEALHKAIGARILQFVNDNFESDGKLVISSGWPALSPVTISLRRKGSSLILRDYGKLKQSFDIFGVKADSKAVTIGTADVRASLHQHGGKVKWGNHYVTIPARPMIPAAEKAKSIIKPLLEERLKRIAANARN